MHPIPRYWATVEGPRTVPGRGASPLTVNGSSDVSVEDARRDAVERLGRLLAAGGPAQWGGRGFDEHEYYPQRRVPEELLEEVRSEDGALIAAITRNRYGAAVLNTDAVLISDIDLPEERTRRSRPRGAARERAKERPRPGLLARLFGRDAAGGASGLGASPGAGLGASPGAGLGASPGAGLGASPGAGVSASPGAGVSAGLGPDPASGPGPAAAPGAAPGSAEADARGLRGAGERGEAHDRILARIDEFTLRHPELGVRVYRTRNGFRLIISGADAAPSGDRARELLQELRSDSLYMILCRVQDCYRARLTPKPWRIDVDRFARLGTRTPEDAVHREWVARYRDASCEVAVCRLVEVSGPSPSAVEQQIIALHDRATRPESGLPLA